MPAPLTFSKNKNKNNVSYLIDTNYPELFVILMSMVLFAFEYQFSSQAIMLLGIVSLVSFIVFYFTHKFGMTSKQTIAVVLLMSIVVGFKKFSLYLTLSFLLLFAIRVILSDASLRLRLCFYAFAGALSSAFLAGRFFNYSADVSSQIEGSVEVVIVILAVLIAIWQFYIIQYDRQLINRQLTASQDRKTTMVSVINKLTRYIPPQVWQPVIRYDASVEVSNKRTKLTVMFSDIAGFTELSERLSADDVADILNTYMQHMTEIAQRYDAVLDKFIGDGMVCFFGAPTSKGAREDALACAAMAIDMRREMRSLRHQWRLRGFEGLYIRIGITTGYCHVGNFGSPSRMSYTLIGSEANLAARLEAAADNSAILISQSTYDYICHDYDCEYQGRLELKGFSEPVKTYAVLDPDANERTDSRWVDYDLPGFNLHLNFEDIKNYDYQLIKTHLNQALLKVSQIEKNKKDK